MVTSDPLSDHSGTGGNPRGSGAIFEVKKEISMGNDNNQELEALKIAAYVVIVAYGIHMASHLVSILLLSLLYTYALLPFPQWLVRRFHFHKNAALSCTLLVVIALYSVQTFALIKAGVQLSAKLPVYKLRIQELYQQFNGFLTQQGIESIGDSVNAFLSSSRMTQLISDILPAAVGLVSHRLLIWFLTLLFLIELLDPERGNSPIAQRLANFGKDTQRYIASTAETGAIIGVDCAGAPHVGLEERITRVSVPGSDGNDR